MVSWAPKFHPGFSGYKRGGLHPLRQRKAQSRMLYSAACRWLCAELAPSWPLRGKARASGSVLRLAAAAAVHRIFAVFGGRGQYPLSRQQPRSGCRRDLSHFEQPRQRLFRMALVVVTCRCGRQNTSGMGAICRTRNSLKYIKVTST